MTLTIRPGITINPGINVIVPLPAPSSVITSSSSVNEGSTITFTSSSTGVPNGTLYWTRYGGAANDADFSAVNGSFTVTNGVGTFTVTPVADHLTEGTELFSVVVRTGSITGPIIGTSAGKQILDTSQTPTYTLSTAGNVTSIDEGAELTFNVTTTDVDDGTTLWWHTGYGGTNMSVGRLSPWYGTVTVASNAASFNITVSADELTSPDQQHFTVYLYKNGPAGGGGIQVDSIAINVNDTSQTPPTHGSAVFNQPENDYMSVPAGSYLNLGTTWTIEFWIYMNYGSNDNTHIQGGIWGLLNQDGWGATNSINIGLASGYLQVAGINSSAQYRAFIEPNPQQWVHVAIVNNAGTQSVFYNGIQQVQVNSDSGNGNYSNSTSPLYIGSLNTGNSFDGKLTNLSITNTAAYATNFYPPTTLPTKISGTKLLWTPTDAALATDTSDSAATITNNGVTYDSSYPLSDVLDVSAVFDGSTLRYYKVAGGSHFQLGTTWTIEWWQKSVDNTTVPNGKLYAVMGQGADGGRIDIYYQDGSLKVQNGQALCAEPPAGEWVHVALVNDAESGTVYYNGVAQSASGNFGNYGQTQDLYIGKRGYISYQPFNGKLTNIRITNRVEYGKSWVFGTDFAYGQIKLTDDGAGNTYLMIVQPATTMTDMLSVGDTITIDTGTIYTTTIAAALGIVPNDPYIGSYPNSRGYRLTNNLGITGQPDINVGVVTLGSLVPDILPKLIPGHTKLLLTPTVDTVYGVDRGDNNLAIQSSGIRFNSDYPQIVVGGTITDTVTGNSGLYGIDYTTKTGVTVSSIAVKDATTLGSVSIVGTTIFYLAPCFQGSYDIKTGYDHQGSEIDNFSLYFTGNFGKTIVPVSVTINAV
jgi:hypothetical protein